MQLQRLAQCSELYLEADQQTSTEVSLTFRMFFLSRKQRDVSHKAKLDEPVTVSKQFSSLRLFLNTGRHEEVLSHLGKLVTAGND